MASMTFLINDSSTEAGGIPVIQVTITELADGTLQFDVVQLAGYVGDFRGLFFDIADESLLGSLQIVSSTTSVTEFAQGNDSIKDLGNGANMNGLLGDSGGYDVGIELGSSGLGKDDIRDFSFVLDSNAHDLTLAHFSNVWFGARLTSVGLDSNLDGAFETSRSGSSKTGEQTFTVLAPKADAQAVLEDGTATGNVLANDGAGAGDTLTVTGWVNASGQSIPLGSAVAISSLAGATVTLNANGTYTVDATNADSLAAGETATHTFTYTVHQSNADGTSTHTQTFTVTVTGTNDGPVAAADTVSGTENETLTIDVLANDTDVDDDSVLTVTAASTPAGQGAASIVGNQVVFTPGTDFDHLNAGDTAQVTLSYSIEDEHGATSSSTVTITVTGTNDGPVANLDAAAGEENETLTIDVLANDTDVDDDSVLTVTAASTPAGQGAASIVGNQVVFTPGTDFDHLNVGDTAQVTLSYSIEDEHGATSSSTVTITVTGTNDGPVANLDAAAGEENETLTIDVLANDTDVDDDSVLTVTAASTPAGQGAASIVGNQVVFTPGTDFDHLNVGDTAQVTLSYSIEDEHGATSSSTVTITVTGTNDGPVANVDAAAGEENETLTIDVLANDTDVDDDSVLTVTAASTPAGQGAASIVGNQVVFTPGTDFDHLNVGDTAQVTLSYSIEDEHGATSSSTVTITVTGTNDGPVANLDTAAGEENETLTIDVLANDTDVDDDSVLTVTAASTPAGQGAASIVGNQVVFTPGTDFDHLNVGDTAQVTLSYSIEDEHGATSSSTVTITVTGTNDGPVANLDTAAGEENETLTIDVLANDTDVDDDSVLTVTAASTPAGQGAASIVGNQVVFTPGTDFDHLNAGDTAQVTLSYSIEDEHGATSSSTVTITVTGTNDGPVANVDTAAGEENETLTIDVLANDTDVDDDSVLTVTAASTPAGQGAASIVGNQVVFTPGTDFDHLNAGDTAQVTLSYTIEDEHGATSSSTVTITVTGTNDGPVANVDTAAGEENETLTIDVLANDTDVDDDSVLTVTAASTPAGQGAASIVGNQVVFTPGTDFDHLNAGDTAQVTLSYSIEDEHGATSSSTVTITVTGTNDGPVANLDTAAGEENETLTIDVLANDTDVDDDSVLTVTAASTPAGQGAASIVGNQVVFTPGTDFDHLNVGDTAQVTLSYSIEDEHGATSSSTVTITVTGTNDAPVAVADVNSGNEDTSITGTVATNDSDVDDGATLSYSLNAPVAGLTLSANGDYSFDAGNAAYQHLALGATTDVVANYTVTDQHGATSTNSLTITLTGTNDVATISGQNAGAVTEDNAINTTSGTLVVSDVDSGEAVFQPIAMADLNKTYGSFTFNATTGAWTYALDNSRAAVQALSSSQTVTDTLTVASMDGTDTETITVTITGADEPVLNHAPTGIDFIATTWTGGNTLPGNGVQLATLQANDPDAGDTFTYTFNASAGPSSVVSQTTTFTITGNSLSSTGLTEGQLYQLAVFATDAAGASISETLRIYTGLNSNSAGETTSTSTDDDIIYTLGSPGANKDIVFAGTGDDTVFGQDGIDELYGEGGNDVLYGGAGNDILDGGAGNDILDGGLGNDILTGGLGNDTFRFASALGSTNVDHITDFDASADKIWLSKAVFGGLTTAGSSGGTTLAAADYTEVASGGATASMGSARILYDLQTGNLYYDANGGDASTGRTLFAVLDNKPALNSMDASDFTVIL